MTSSEPAKLSKNARRKALRHASKQATARLHEWLYLRFACDGYDDRDDERQSLNRLVDRFLLDKGFDRQAFVDHALTMFDDPEMTAAIDAYFDGFLNAVAGRRPRKRTVDGKDRNDQPASCGSAND